MTHTRYLNHGPILLTFEDEGANLLARGHTYRLDEAEGTRLERLLRDGQLSEQAYAENNDLIEFLLAERLVSLGDMPTHSALSVKDFRDPAAHRGWLTLRLLCFGFVLFVGVVDLLVLPGSYRGFVDAVKQSPWLPIFFVIPVLLHEAVHYYTGKAFGLAGKAGVGIRGWAFPVATVTFANLYELPKHKRWLPILAPTVVDSAIFLALLPARGTSLAAFFHFFYGVGILWQFLIFLRTDIYLFVATMFNEPNLNQLVWRRGATTSFATLSASEKKAASLYLAVFAFCLIVLMHFLSISLQTATTAIH